MQRSRRFLRSAASGYLLVGSLAMLNLVTVPFALNALGKELFGLCMAVIQATTFLAIFELGVGPSVARFIADYKDDRENPAYASLLKSVLAAGVVRAAVLMVCVTLAADLIRRLFKIPDPLATQFCHLLLMNLGVTALSYVFGPFSQLLYAHQRIDLSNYSSIAANLVATAALLLALHAGAGIYAYAVSIWTAFVVNNALVFWAARRLKFIPALRAGRVSFHALKPLMGYAANVIFISAGVQLIAVTPSVLVSRILGISALADWTVGVRLLTLCNQLVGRVPNASEPAFWEMHVRGEIERLRVRLLEIARVSVAIAALAAGGLVAANSSFIHVWTSGRVTWPWYYNIGCALWLLLSTVSLVWNTLPGITKRLGVMKYVYLGEGALMILPAFLGLEASGLFWVPWWLALGTASCRCIHGAVRLRSDLGLPLLHALGQMGGHLLLGAACVTAGALAHFLFRGTAPAFHMTASLTVYAALAVPAACFWGLPAEVRPRLAGFWKRIIPRCANDR